MKTLSLIFSILLASAFTTGDFGEGGGPKSVRPYTLRSSDLVGYKNRVEYALFIDRLAKKSYDLEDNQKTNFYTDMKSNLSKKSNEQIENKEEFIIKRSKLTSRDFGEIELQSISAFYLQNGENYHVDDICSYVVAMKRKNEVAQLKNLLQLNSCVGKKISTKLIKNIKVEYRK